MPYRPRRRMIDPTVKSSRRVGRLTYEEKWLFVCLISLSDDEGRLEADARIVRAEAFKFDDFTVNEVEEMLAHVADAGLGVLYQVGDGIYFEHDDFCYWNPVPPSKFTASNLPPCNDPAATLLHGSYDSASEERSKVAAEEQQRRSKAAARSKEKVSEVKRSEDNSGTLRVRFHSGVDKSLTEKLKHYGFTYRGSETGWSCDKPTEAACAYFEEMTADHADNIAESHPSP